MSILDIIILLILIAWLTGTGLHIGGSLIHLLLIIAVVVLIVRIIQGRNVV